MIGAEVADWATAALEVAFLAELVCALRAAVDRFFFFVPVVGVASSSAPDTIITVNKFVTRRIVDFCAFGPPPGIEWQAR